MTHYCLACHAVATNQCACCSEAFYCSRECQKADWPRIHREEARVIRAHRDCCHSFGATEEKEPGTLEREEPLGPAPRKRTRLDELIERRDAVIEEYRSVVEQVARADLEEKARFRKVRKSRHASRAEEARIARLVAMNAKREEAEKWQLHDDFDRMIDQLYGLMSSPELLLEGGKPEIGDYERMWMVYTKRRLSLLRVKRTLSLMTHRRDHFDEAFALEQEIKEETDRFVHEWLLDDRIDYETTKTRYQVQRLATYTDQYIEYRWDELLESLVQQAMRYKRASEGDTDPSLVVEQAYLAKMDRIDPDTHWEASISAMELTCTSFITAYDVRLQKQYERGEISELVWHNSTAFIDNIYKALRSRGLDLIEDLTELMENEESWLPFSVNQGVSTGSGRDDRAERFRKRKEEEIAERRRAREAQGQAEEEEEVEGEGEEEREGRLREFMDRARETMGNFLPTMIKAGLVIGLLVMIVYGFAAALGPLIASMSYLRGPQVVSSENTRSLAVIEEEGAATAIVSVEQEERLALRVLNNVRNYSLEEMNDMTSERREEFSLALSALQGDIRTYEGFGNIPPINVELWGELAKQPAFIDYLMIETKTSMDALFPAHITHLTERDILEDPRAENTAGTVIQFRRIMTDINNYTASTDEVERARILQNLIAKVNVLYEPGIKLYANNVQTWIKSHLGVLLPLRDTGETIVAPLFDTLSAEVESEYAPYRKAMKNLSATKEEIVKTDIELADLIAKWRSRALASDLLITRDTGSLIQGMLYGLFYANALTRLGVQAYYQTIGRLYGFYDREGMPWPTDIYQLGLSFVQTVVPFIIILYLAYRTLRALVEVLRILPTLRSLIDGWASWILSTEHSKEQIKRWAESINTLRAEADQLKNWVNCGRRGIWAIACIASWWR